MTELPDPERRLEQLMDQALRGLPAHRAPLSLESSVLREIERLAARPWWRRTYAHWPIQARGAFILVCASLIGLMFLLAGWASGTVLSWHESGALPISSVRHAVAIVTAAAELAGLLASSIPHSWLYTGLAAGTALYTALFGLGAAAYRTLYLSPPHRQVTSP
jgi:hypothetical protein